MRKLFLLCIYLATAFNATTWASKAESGKLRELAKSQCMCKERQSDLERHEAERKADLKARRIITNGHRLQNKRRQIQQSQEKSSRKSRNSCCSIM